MWRISPSAAFSRSSALGKAGGAAAPSVAIADSISSLIDTSVWLVLSCSSRDRCARSASCVCTTWRASSRSFASAMRDSLTFSTRPHAPMSPTLSTAMPAIHHIVAVTLPFTWWSICATVACTSSR